METQIVKLTPKEIQEQLDYANKYKALIEREIAMEDLVNVENVTKWTKSFKKHSQLAKSGEIVIAKF